MPSLSVVLLGLLKFGAFCARNSSEGNTELVETGKCGSWKINYLYYCFGSTESDYFSYSITTKFLMILTLKNVVTLVNI